MQIRRLNAVRGIAVLIVLVSHYSNVSKIYGGVLGNGAGQFGVMLFFMLSAFLMSYLYFEKRPSSENIRLFCVARSARVLPLFILVVLASYFAHLILPVGVSKVFYPISTIEVLLSNLFLLSGVSVLWTIPPEIQFYAIFALLWWASQWFGRFVLAAPIFLLIIYTLFPLEIDWQNSVLGVPIRLMIFQVYPYFCVGLILGVVYKNLTLPGKLKSDYFLISLAVIPLLYPMIFSQIFGYSHGMWADPGVLLSVSLIFLLVVFLVPEGNGFLENKIGDFLGKVSYSAYLLHYPILLSLKNSGLANGLGDGLLFIALTLGVSLISFVAFESPARMFVRNFFAPKTTCSID